MVQVLAYNRQAVKLQVLKPKILIFPSKEKVEENLKVLVYLHNS